VPGLADAIFAYRLAHAPSLAAWQAQAYAGATFDSYDRIGAIQAPTLVVQGGGDNVVDPRNAELLGELIPNARVEIVPDRGHLLVWEDSERVAELVMEFLS
jgi:pimeloyl-ACP methyl ester carboxylesterase